MWTVRIDGNPTVTCGNEQTALHTYRCARQWEQTGHRVEMFRGRTRILPSLPTRGA